MARARGVVNDAVGVRVLAGEKSRPAGRAERRRSECVREPGSFARESVDIRRVNERMANNPRLIPSHVIDENHDDVRWARLCTANSRVLMLPGHRTRGRQKGGYENEQWCLQSVLSQTMLPPSLRTRSF